MDKRIDELGLQIKQHFNGALPPVTIIRLLDKSRVAIYDTNAMSTYVLEKFGLTGEYQVAASTWGLAVKPIKALGSINNGHVMNIEPYYQADQLYQSRLWQAMPFVATDRYHLLPSRAFDWLKLGLASNGDRHTNNQLAIRPDDIRTCRR